MGYALARAALKAGHKVTLVSAPVGLRPPANINIVRVETAIEMFAAVKEHFGRCDCLIMAAAVSDFAPVAASKTKIKKTGKALNIRLKPTPDILKWAARRRKNQVVIGFALEDKDLRARAQKKLEQKNLDMIIANKPTAIGGDQACVQIKVRGGKWLKLSKAAKTTIAKKIIALGENCGRAIEI